MAVVTQRFWRGFWQLADPKIWVASTVPMIVAAALAYAHTGRLHVGWALSAMLGIYLIEIGKNAVNECVDYLSGVDAFVAEDKKTPFSGGKKTIIDGKLTFRESAVIGVVTLSAAFLIGLAIAVVREPSVLWIGIAGLAISIFYSLPPFKFIYHGLGEMVVGLAFGPLLMSGMYVMLTGNLDSQTILASLPLAFLITNVLWINQYPDYEADRKGGKRNWLVRIGKRAGIKVYAALFACAYIGLAVLAATSGNPYWLLGFVSLPLAVRSVRVASGSLENLPVFLKANANTVLIYQLIGLTMIAAAFMT